MDFLPAGSGRWETLQELSRWEEREVGWWLVPPPLDQGQSCEMDSPKPHHRKVGGKKNTVLTRKGA